MEGIKTDKRRAIQEWVVHNIEETFLGLTQLSVFDVIKDARSPGCDKNHREVNQSAYSSR